MSCSRHCIVRAAAAAPEKMLARTYQQRWQEHLPHKKYNGCLSASRTVSCETIYTLVPRQKMARQPMNVHVAPMQIENLMRVGVHERDLLG
jgi:hypothetical protein